MAIRAYRYRLPLKHSIRLGSRDVAERDGILLESNGRWAEAAPLPYFSRESIDDVIAALRGEVPEPASLEFARTSLEIEDQACELDINALLQGTDAQVLARCESLREQRCKAIKLKVGRNDWQQDVTLVRQVRSLLRPDQALRLDANRAWEWETAVQFANGVAGVEIEYVEEPLQSPGRLEELTQRTNLPYALDETIQEGQSLDTFANARAFVIKPTLVGKADRVAEASKLGRPLVFSACYESGVGIAQIARLANYVGATKPAGLDTYSYMSQDTLVKRLRVVDWRMQVPAQLEVNSLRLEEVPI